MSEYVKNLLILVASKSHKSNHPNKVGVQNIGTDSSLIVTYSLFICSEKVTDMKE